MAGIVIHVSLAPPSGRQTSAQLTARRPTRAPLRDVQGWIAEHSDGDLGVPALAARARMSERNVIRVFRAETGQTPAAYVEATRLEAARQLLEASDAGVAAVYGLVEALARSPDRRTA